MISVGFSTYDRVENVPELLAAFAAQEDPGEPWEIIAVDNCGPPAMRQVIEAHLPANGRYLREERRGSSHGRNLFFSSAAGDLLILTDDDALPDPGWLRAYAMAARHHPEIDLFTGPVHYVWRCDQPAWHPGPPRHEIVLVYHSDWGSVDSELDANSCIGGHNIAIRREAFQQLGGFDPRLGPGSPHDASGEDMELVHRYFNAGKRIMYVAAARTGHRISEERTRRNTLRANYHRAGYSESWEVRACHLRHPVLPMPPWWIRKFVCDPFLQFCRMIGDIFRDRRAAAFYHRLRLSHWHGQIRFLKDLLLHRISPSPYNPAAHQLKEGQPTAFEADGADSNLHTNRRR
jgi:GT2 family glycosyltransferase